MDFEVIDLKMRINFDLNSKKVLKFSQRNKMTEISFLIHRVRVKRKGIESGSPDY
jgi:hypothetical protein